MISFPFAIHRLHGERIVRWGKIVTADWDQPFFVHTLKLEDHDRGWGTLEHFIEMGSALPLPKLGYLFFMPGRCGSSLVVRSLNASAQDRCISEPQLLNSILLESELAPAFPLAATLRAVLGFYGQLAGGRTLHIKTTPHNVLWAKALRENWSGFQPIALTRSPREVALSFQRKPAMKIDFGSPEIERRLVGEVRSGTDFQKLMVLLREIFLSLDEMVQAGVPAWDYRQIAKRENPRQIQIIDPDFPGLEKMFSNDSKAPIAKTDTLRISVLHPEDHTQIDQIIEHWPTLKCIQ